MHSPKTKTMIKTALSAVLLAGIMTIPALAATKTMSSVTVRVGAEATSYSNDSINCDVSESLDSQQGNYAAVDSTKYSVRTAEWLSLADGGLRIGTEPEMRVYLQMGDEDFRFSSNYTKKSAVIRGGTLLAAEKINNELVLDIKLDPIEGRYAEPNFVTWTTAGYGPGLASWGYQSEHGLTGDAFDVSLYRGNTLVKQLNEYQGTSYDFYPYMRKAGSYHVKVRAVPYSAAEKAHGKKSEWSESSGLSISEDQVSDGTGQGAWILQNDAWYFQNPDQSLQKDTWFMVNAKWYLLDAEGQMLTGFQTKDGHTYYLDGKGIMTIGWSQIGGQWYYFYPDGIMAANTTIDGFVIGANGVWAQ